MPGRAGFDEFYRDGFIPSLESLAELGLQVIKYDAPDLWLGLVVDTLIDTFETCRRLVRDHGRVVHTVEVEAYNRCHAFGLAMGAFRKCSWTNTDYRGVERLTVAVQIGAKARRISVSRDEFETWLSDPKADSGVPEDIALMRKVMLSWRCEQDGPEPTLGTAWLAEHFAREIGRCETYIRVPEDNKKDVIAYVNTMLKASGDEERAD